jgi:3-methyladenine DNA glycosylase AlkD
VARSSTSLREHLLNASLSGAPYSWTGELPMPAKAKPSPTVKPAPRAAKAARPRLTLAEAMTALEQAGSEQTRKTYLRHGASEPLFGVSFATLKSLLKSIGVDHELALALWDTGNYDARNLAAKIADPAQMTTAALEHWARTGNTRSCMNYVACLAGEGPYGFSSAQSWLAAADPTLRTVAWSLVGTLAMVDEAIADVWFRERLAEIEQHLHGTTNSEREQMNHALIAIGCRNEDLRDAASAAARRIGKVHVDHGDTACKTPDAVAYINKTWDHSSAKGYASPAAHERSREPLRLRC